MARAPGDRQKTSTRSDEFLDYHRSMQVRQTLADIKDGIRTDFPLLTMGLRKARILPRLTLTATAPAPQQEFSSLGNLPKPATPSLAPSMLTHRRRRLDRSGIVR